jgi:flagellar biosynthesis/type III secretory pathway chaperone
MSTHYRSHPSGIEAIEITQYESFLRGNIIKYLLRAPYKGTELQDLFKAKQYLEWEIERVQEQQWEENWLQNVVEERVKDNHEEIKERRERLLQSINSLDRCCGK